MKEKLIFGIISILFLSLSSCKSDEPDGKWDDNIKLSEKEINFTAESNSVVITTEGTWWWINGIGLDDDWSYDISGIDTTQENFLIEKTEFTIERRNANKIYISMTENQSDSERTLTISLQAGDYFDGIKIIQSEN
jgi:hypothetical protein